MGEAMKTETLYLYKNPSTGKTQWLKGPFFSPQAMRALQLIAFRIAATRGPMTQEQITKFENGLIYCVCIVRVKPKLSLDRNC